MIRKRAEWLSKRRRATDDVSDPLQDRPSTPHLSPQRLVQYRRLQIEKRRRQRWSSRSIAQYYDLPISTVVTEIRRMGLRDGVRSVSATHDRPFSGCNTLMATSRSSLRSCSSYTVAAPRAPSSRSTR